MKARKSARSARSAPSSTFTREASASPCSPPRAAACAARSRPRSRPSERTRAWCSRPSTRRRTPTRGPRPTCPAARSRSRSTPTAPSSRRARSTPARSSSPCSPPPSVAAERCAREGRRDRRCGRGPELAPRVPRARRGRRDGGDGREIRRLARRARGRRGLPLLRAHLHDGLLPAPDRAAPDRQQGLSAQGQGRAAGGRSRPLRRRLRQPGRRRRRAADRRRRRAAAEVHADQDLQRGRRGARLQALHRRRLVPLLRRPRAQAHGLLRLRPPPGQRRQGADRLLLPRPQGLLRHVLQHERPMLIAVLAAAALVAGLTGAWSPCGFSMVETLAPGGYAGRLRTTATACTTFALGALAGGVITFGGLAAIGHALGAGAPLVAAFVAVAAAAGEAKSARIVPQVRRQVPESWRRRLPVPLAAGLYGILLGLGFTTFILTFAVWALAATAIALGDPHAGLAIGLGFGAGRALPVVALAPRGGGALHAKMAEQPKILRTLRLADALALTITAAALIASPAHAATSTIAFAFTDPSVDGATLALHRPGATGELRT